MSQIPTPTGKDDTVLGLLRENIKETRDLKEMIAGSTSQRGLIHRMDDAEKFISGFKKYALIFIIAVSSGQPLVDRILPARESIVTDPSAEALANLLRELIDNTSSESTIRP